MSYSDDLTLNYFKKSREDNIGEPDSLMKAMNRAGLVQKEVQVRGKNGQTFTRKQWVKAGEDKSASTQSSSSEENTMEARKKLKEEIDNYVKTHNPPSDEDRKKVSDMRDKYQQMVKDSMNKTKKQISEKLKSESQKSPSSTEKKQDTTSKNHDKQVINDKFNFAYAGDTSEIKKTDEIKVGDKIGYVVTRKVNRNGGDHSFSGTVYSAVFDGKPIKVSDANDNKITPINYEDNSAFRNYNDCVDSLKDAMNSSSHQSLNGTKTQESPKNNTPNSSSTWKKVGSSQEAKQQIASVLASGKSREDCMAEFKKLGVTWKENDHAGINWMRASMAMNKYLTSGNNTDVDDKPNDSTANTDNNSTDKDAKEVSESSQSNTPSAQEIQSIADNIKRTTIKMREANKAYFASGYTDQNAKDRQDKADEESKKYTEKLRDVIDNMPDGTKLTYTYVNDDGTTEKKVVTFDTVTLQHKDPRYNGKTTKQMIIKWKDKNGKNHTRKIQKMFEAGYSVGIKHDFSGRGGSGKVTDISVTYPNK